MSRLIREADLIQGLQAVRDRETGTPRMMTEWFMTNSIQIEQTL